MLKQTWNRKTKTTIKLTIMTGTNTYFWVTSLWSGLVITTTLQKPTQHKSECQWSRYYNPVTKLRESDLQTTVLHTEMKREVQ